MQPEKMKVKIWGVRGSLPTPILPAQLQHQLKQVINDFEHWRAMDQNAKDPSVDRFMSERPRHKGPGFGGNTPCVEVSTTKTHLIIDGGSGIRLLGYEMMAGPCGKGKGEAHLLFTHFHWDHLIGLPFFAPIFIPGNKIHVYAVQSDLKSVFQTLFKKPYFPVPLEQLGAEIIYHELEPRKPHQLGDILVTPYQLDHPDPCWGYKFEKNGRAYSHCVDTECTRVSRADLGPDLPLYQGIDTMLFDAQYTLMETIEKVNWGHAAASLGLDIAMREGIRKVIFVHHDPASSDEKIAAAEHQARRYYTSQLKSTGQDENELKPVEWIFGYEGLVLEV